VKDRFESSPITQVTTPSKSPVLTTSVIGSVPASRRGPVYVLVTCSPSILAVIAGFSLTTRNASPSMSIRLPDPSSIFAVSAG
jgi:hypothetical protein